MTQVYTAHRLEFTRQISGIEQDVGRHLYNILVKVCLSTLLEEGLRGSRGLSEGMREVSLGNLAHPIPEGG